MGVVVGGHGSFPMIFPLFLGLLADFLEQVDVVVEGFEEVGELGLGMLNLVKFFKVGEELGELGFKRC